MAPTRAPEQQSIGTAVFHAAGVAAALVAAAVLSIAAHPAAIIVNTPVAAASLHVQSFETLPCICFPLDVHSSSCRMGKRRSPGYNLSV